MKFLLVYLANEEIQSRKIQYNQGSLDIINIYFLNFPTPISAEIPRSQDKRAGISKFFLSFSTLFLYIPWYLALVFLCAYNSWRKIRKNRGKNHVFIPPKITPNFYVFFFLVQGLWEIPLVMWNDLRNGRCSMLDACSNPSNPDDVYQLLWQNFARHYNTNR